MMIFGRYLTLICSFVAFICLAGLASACEGQLLDDATIYGAPLCVPAQPKRVVLLDPTFSLGVGMDVGLPIVGAPLDLMSDERLKEQSKTRGITSIGLVTEPSLERIVALKPDLIVGFTGSTSLAATIHPQLSQIAPTLLETGIDWRAFYKTLAKLTGRQSEVADRLRDYEKRLADVRSRMPDIKVSIIRITAWDFQVYLDAPQTYAPFAVAREAGLRRPKYETTSDPSLSMKRPDWEDLAQLDGDVLLYIVGGTNNSDVSGRHEEVIANPLWRMLPAVHNKRVHRIDHATWMEFSGLASAHRVLDDIERYVIGKP